MHIAQRTSMLFFLGLVTLLCAVEWWIVTSVWFSLNADLLSLAVTGDLILGIPLLYYFFFIRTRRRPAITLAPVFLVAVVIANILLPAAQHTYLDRIEYLLPFIEGVVVLVVLAKARAVVRVYRNVRPQVVYPSDALEISLRQTLGASPVVKLLVTELSLPYYVLVGWHKSFAPPDPSHVAFSYHRKSSYGAVIAMFTSLLVIETFVLHLLIQHWSPIIAWILTGLNIYSLFWLLGDYYASRLHPIVFGLDHLYIRTGLRWRADVPLSKIVGIRKATRTQGRIANYVNAAVYGEPHSILELKEPVIVHGVFGIQKKVTEIGLTVDDEPQFQVELRNRIQA